MVTRTRLPVTSLESTPRMLAIDLHTHSSCSDGSLTPSQLVQEASRIGLAAIAMTDHDTMAGVGKPKAPAKNTASK